MRKGYRLADVEYSGSQMANKMQVSSKEKSLDKTAIKEKHLEIKNKADKEILEHKAKTKKTLGKNSMYTSECPQCKDESIKEILVDSNKRDSYYIRRITASNNTIEVLGIKQAVEEVKELKEDITEIREEIDKLTEKQEAKIKSQNNTPNKNSSKISHDSKMKPYVSYSTNSDHFEIRDCYVLYQKHEEHSCLPKMWYEKNWDKSDKKQKIKVREKEIDDEGNLIVVDAITELAEGVEERHKNTIWSKENDTISLKLPYGAKTGADSTIQIPRPTRLRKTVYDDSKFPLESLWKKIIAQNDQYAKELATLTSQLKTLRILLEEKELDILDAKNNKTKYVCNECKNQSLPITKRKKWDIPIDIDPNCSNCKDEYNKLKKLIIENTKLVYPLLSIKLPVCNTCVTKWGKEAILKCL